MNLRVLIGFETLLKRHHSFFEPLTFNVDVEALIFSLGIFIGVSLCSFG